MSDGISDSRQAYWDHQTHCDRCRKKSFAFYESRYWYKGSLCGSCRSEVFKEIGIDRSKSHDYTVNQGPILNEFCKDPFI